MNNTFSLAVGENFPFPRKSGGNGIKLEAHPLGIFLCVYSSNPKDKEISCLKNDAVTLHLTYIQPILECVIQVEDDFWGDAPYFAPLYHKQISAAEMKPRKIYICLIDSDSNILKSLRIIDLPFEMTAFIYKAQISQYASDISDEEYNEMLEDVQQKLSVKDLARIANAAINIGRDNTVKAVVYQNI